MIGIPSWAVRGAKVVCVHDLNARKPIVQGAHRGPYPVKGEVLTIAEVCATPMPHATTDEYGDRLGLRFIFLRPVAPMKTAVEDLALFRKYLNQPVDA